MEQTEFTCNEEWFSEENNLLSKIDWKESSYKRRERNENPLRKMIKPWQYSYADPMCNARGC